MLLRVEGLDKGLRTVYHRKRNSQLPSELAASFRFPAHVPQSHELFSEFLKMLVLTDYWNFEFLYFFFMIFHFFHHIVRFKGLIHYLEFMINY